MAFTYFVNNSLAPVAGGNAYATKAKCDLMLNFHPRWQMATSTEREQLIMDATAQLDSLDYVGTLVSGTQPLQFPRVMSTEITGEFTLVNQVRRLFRALVQQIEYNLSRQGMGVTQYSHVNESFTPRQDTICREALMSLTPYLRN
jgi:hypothetical protein